MGERVIYNGRPVAKEDFRTFIYGLNKEKKLVNTWDEFETHISSGLWFARAEDVISKPITKARQKKKEPESEPKAQEDVSSQERGE